MNDFFNNLQKGYDVICPYLNYDKEPGLANRVKLYNSHCFEYKFVLVFPVHVNAASNPAKWWKSTKKGGGGGVEIWTDRFHDYSDELANEFMDKLIQNSNEEIFRLNAKDDASKDANFTVIHGYHKGEEFIKRKYEAMLLESLFMDNEVDIKKLKDLKWNNEWMKSVGFALDYTMKTQK